MPLTLIPRHAIVPAGCEQLQANSYCSSAASQFGGAPSEWHFVFIWRVDSSTAVVMLSLAR